MLRWLCGIGLWSLLLAGQLAAQSVDLTFEQLPGYERYREMNEARSRLTGGGRVQRPEWSADGQALHFTVDNQRRTLDLTRFEVGEYQEAEQAQPSGDDLSAPQRPRRRAVPRAQQRPVEPSPDGKWNAVYRDFNVWLEPGDASDVAPLPVTTAGHELVRYGTCCWVYGEELDQNEAMWWSPDGSKLVFYEVDERGMRDYYLTLNNQDLYTELLAVRYPKAGDLNPQVALLIYDLADQTTRRLEISGEERQYLYNIRFTPQGNEILVNRTNRHQNVLDVLAIDVEQGAVRTVVTERQDTWQANAPAMTFLSDGLRFVWETERNGYKHFELRHLDGRLLHPLSQVAEYPCQRVEQIDEANDWFYYTAMSDANPYNAQLHRVRLSSGTEHQRLTSAPLNHTSFSIASDHRFVLAVREQFDTPPSTVVYDSLGNEVAVLAVGSTDRAEAEGLPPSELFTFLADDGETVLWGVLHKPSHFDPARRYPLLIDVYGGPSSSAFSNRYTPLNPICEFGYVVAKIGNRGTAGRGKAFETAGYQRLGDIDIADQAAGVRALRERPYIDDQRVGIFGHSYGGYMSALAVLKYPDVFHVAVSGAPVTDWRNYDTIYTERYMRTPQENESGYDAGSCMKYASQLQGKLLLVHGLIDDNVHPSNTWQLARALHAANKRFDMMIYPEFAHGVGSTYNALRWEYFYRHLRPDAHRTAEPEQ